RAVITPELPDVTIELTPSFPALPGQTVQAHVIADSLADITGLTLTLDGQPLSLDAFGRASFVAGSPGKMVLAGSATDAEGLVGTTTRTVKIREASDSEPPAVAFSQDLFPSQLTSSAAVVASVEDVNLDYWKLELASGGSNDYVEIARGEGTVVGGTLTEIDPRQLANGFYRLRLTAEDIGRRRSATEIGFEVNTPDKLNAFRVSETDVVVSLGGTDVAIVRSYDSLQHDIPGRLGNGWRLVNRDVQMQIDAPLTGREALGVYHPISEGTRLYLALPNGTRAGFTFDPVPVQVPGLPDNLVYYRPAWSPDDGVAYQLDSVDTLLVRGGDRYYDQSTGQPYHPANPFFEGADYILTAPDGTRDLIDSRRGIVERVTADGTRLFISDSGIAAESGETIQFVHDPEGRLAAIKLPDGEELHYLYDAAGNLTEVVHSTDGSLVRSGYRGNATGQLSVIARADGTGKALLEDGALVDVTGVLGYADQFNGRPVSNSLDRGKVHYYSFSISDQQVQSTTGGLVIVRVVIERQASLFVAATPEIAGLTPLSRYVDGDRTVALFGIDSGNTFLLKVRGATETDRGGYRLHVDVAGDVDLNGSVDGTDSQLLEAAAGTLLGDSAYRFSADLDADGFIFTSDRQILANNFGFTGVPVGVVLPDYFSFSDATNVFTPAADSGGSDPGDGGDPPGQPGGSGQTPLPPAGGGDPSDDDPGQPSEPQPLVPLDGVTFGIRNGLFSQDGGDWTTRGSVMFKDGAALIEEGREYSSALMQPFFVPDDAQLLRFTIFDRGSKK
ncbi:MAG: hypothetical protein JJ992_06230, partial [Planctomycetes bacterium]|nr:hypothetical protein [Planctomycetota bacterium]